MPNWCSNHVVVEGSEEEVLSLLALASSGQDEDGFENVFSFENLFPTPSDLLEDDGWYMWRVNSWGTKWDLNQPHVKLEGPEKGGVEGCLVFQLFYETAWSPPLAFWSHVAKKYSTLKITQEFFEEGNCFIGQTFLNGEESTVDEYVLTDEMYFKAGAVFDDEGDIDWDNSAEFDMWKVFPLENHYNY